MSKKKCNNRAKGVGGELELRDLVNEITECDPPCRRSQQYCGVGGDGDLTSPLPLHIECKRTQVAMIYQWMNKAISEAKPGMTPVVFWRKNHEQWLAILQAEEFLKTYKEDAGE